MNIRLSAMLTVGTPRIRFSDSASSLARFNLQNRLAIFLNSSTNMGRRKLHGYDFRVIRGQLNGAETLAREILDCEARLIDLLREIDLNRYYVHYGYKSLSGFCIKDLKFSRTQTQRLVTQVRRGEPTVNIADRPLGTNAEKSIR